MIVSVTIEPLLLARSLITPSKANSRSSKTRPMGLKRRRNHCDEERGKPDSHNPPCQFAGENFCMRRPEPTSPV